MNKDSHPSKDDKKVVYAVEYVNLQDFGYEKAGNVKGDPEVYGAYLNRIINGDLVEENYKGISDEEKIEKRSKLKEIEKEYQEIKSTNENIRNDIKAKEQKIDNKREELLKLTEKHYEDKEALKHETFSSLKFTIGAIILVVLTAYLFMFYISTAYKALYSDTEEIANRIISGLGTGSIMPGPAELSEALRYNYLLFLIPFVFYAFGWAFHIILELRNKFKIVFLVMLITLTFFVDFLLALTIHNNTEFAKEIMGLDVLHWSQSTTFYIILAFGFLTYILWSIILDFIFREWAKRKIPTNIKKIIKHLKNDIKILEKKIIPQEPIEQEIAFIREDIDTVVQGNLKAYIDQFTTGWIAYLQPQNMKELKNKCMLIKKEFEEKHQIKPGIIKVVKRKA